MFTKTTMPDYGMLSSGMSRLPPARAQPVEARPQSRRLLVWRGRGGSHTLRSVAHRHRHRRLGAPARGLVRDFRPQAERRTDPDRSALCRPGRRANIERDVDDAA